ncbi:PLxRFG domain-containing protein, partial [Candidatus Macondimonas diazotrophica]
SDAGLLDTTGGTEGFFKEVKSQVMQRAVGPAWLETAIANVAEDPDNPEATRKFIADLRSLYLDSLPDRSTARVMAHRKGRQGYSTDMVRSYAHRMLIAANHIAGLAVAPVRQETFREIEGAITAAQVTRGVDVSALERMQVVADEFKQRDLDTADPIPRSPMMSMLRAVSHVFFLGLSPAYVLMNVMQVGVLGVPELAKRFGAKKATSAVAAALPDAIKVVRAALREGYKTGGLVGASEMVITSEVLANAGLSPERVNYLVEMMGTGKLDIGTVTREMGRLAAGEVTSDRTVRLNSGLKVLTSFTLMSEILARTTVALAARDLHGAKGIATYASRVIDNSMLNYNAYAIGRATGAKGVLGGLTPVALQFHQYSFQALGRLITETYNAFSRSQGVTDEQRAEAQRFLKSHVAAITLLAGTMGLPFMTVAARLSDMLCEMFGDQPCDTKASLRNFTHDVFGADIEPIVSRGILRVIGGDLSSRVGEADLLPFSRFLADRRTLDEKLRDPLLSISGATGGMLSNIVSGAQKVADGDWLGGVQAMMPTALRGPVKAYSLSTKGFTDNSGVTLPMEPTATDKLVALLGIQPGKEADFMQASRAQRQRTSILSRELSVIRKNIVKAIEQQDREKLREWGRKAAEFQQANPTVDIMQGVTSSLRQRQRMSALSTVGILPGANVRDIGIQERTRFFQPGAQ